MTSLHNIWFVSDASKDWKRYFILLAIPTLVLLFPQLSSITGIVSFIIFIVLALPLSYLTSMLATLTLPVLIWAIFSKNHKVLPKWCMIMVGAKVIVLFSLYL